MIKLFENENALQDSGFLFRILDNGGETYDQITVIFCDGDAIACTSRSICAHIESVDVQGPSDNVESGTERDLRWIDLDSDLRACIIADLNEGYSDWLEAAPAAESRDKARNWEGLWRDSYSGDDRTPIYVRDGKFYIRDDDRQPPHDDGEPGPFDSFVEAVRYMLPQDYDLSGPEYHTTVDLWDTEGGPKPAWDRETDPPVIDEHNEAARAAIRLDRGGEQEETVAWFVNVTDAENYLGNSATIDPDLLEAGAYTIDDLDHPDAPTRRN